MISTSVGIYSLLSTTETGLPYCDFILLILADVTSLTPFFSANFFSTSPTYFPTTPYNGTDD
jgi:hypothetical protein